jgi:ABC-type nitrate/sulfonate/bicarbonate transport system permease component
MWNPYEEVDAGTRRALGVGSVVAVIVAWAVISGTGLVAPNKLPTPWSVASAFLTLAWDAERGESKLLDATLWSSGRVLVAAIMTVSIGVPLGILMGAAPRLNAVLSPVIDPFRSAPIVAILPILVMWLGIGESMKITFLFLGAVVYLVPLVRDAMVAVPSTYYISARDLGATPAEAVWHAVVPIAMPRIADAVIVAISVMWTYITVAEYVNAESGLGRLIMDARRFAAMDQVFVGIFVIIGLALVTYAGMTWAKNRLYDWEVE